MTEGNKNRDIQREVSRIGDTFQLSLIKKSYSSCIDSLQKSANETLDDRNKAILLSKINLLHGLNFRKSMSLEECYEEYLGMIPREFHPNYTLGFSGRQAFVDSILSAKSGIPILIVNSSFGRGILLFDLVAKCEQEKVISQLISLDNILSKHYKQILDEQNNNILTLSKYLPHIMELVDSSRERGLILSICSLLFSSSSIRNYLGIAENVTNSISQDINRLLSEMDDENETLKEKSREHFNDIVKQNEERIKDAEKSLCTKRRLHPQQIEDLDEEIKKRKRRHDMLTKNKERKIQEIASRKLKEWKGKIKRQFGKGKGAYRINREAEKEVFAAIQEHLVAHDRRKGNPETGYIEGRITCKQLTKIANNWLRKNGHKVIKSQETVRSWGKARNKRTRQATQHRGSNLWARQKPQKIYLNIHYNRAHIKYYTRMIFGHATRDKFKQHTIRRAMDDKAYIRCGTSEGFSRPMVKPLVPTLKSENVAIPCYDFPDKVGYVAPGVTLIINDMKEVVDENGKDSYAMTDAIPVVNCKPKYIYDSSSTKWANDMYYTRLCFPEEHEEPGTKLEQFSREELTAFVFLQNSLKQFDMMTILEDFSRIVESEDHAEREHVRITVLIRRLLTVFSRIPSEHPQTFLVHNMLELVNELQNLELKIKECKIVQSKCEDLFSAITMKVKSLMQQLQHIIPKHKSIDIQTTDAGPGVGTSEKLVKFRLAEMFIINDLDLQARFHYAPRDSKTHVVERVMSRLNDALGDGSFIPINRDNILEELGPEKVFLLDKNKLTEKNELINQEAARSCAQKVCQKYVGVPCMGSTLYPHVADARDLYQNFFFDEKYARKCSQATSNKKFNQLPGKAYYSKIQDFISKTYRIYNNGVEGIRQDGTFRCSEEVSRIPAPEPFLNTDGILHYKKISDIGNGFETRDIDDTNPIVQLRSLIEECGLPKIECHEKKGGEVGVIDENNTWHKIQEKLALFVENISGKDLAGVAHKEAQHLYLQLLKKGLNKVSKLKGKLEEKHLHSMLTGPLKIVIKRQPIPAPLPWGGTCFNGNIQIDLLNTCPVDNMLYFCQILFCFRPDILEEFKQLAETDTFASTLIAVYHLFKQKQYGKGKVK